MAAKKTGRRKRQQIHARRVTTPTKIIKADKTKKGISDLPGELRNVIYGYALAASAGGTIPLSRRFGPGISRDIAFGLAGTCRAIYEETIDILHGANSFRVDLPPVTLLTHRRDRALFRQPWNLGYWNDREDWIKLYKPHLLSILKRMPRKVLGRINAFTFAYHAFEKSPLDHFEAWQLSKKPSLIVELRLVKRSPYFLVIWRTDDSLPWKTHAMRSLTPFMEDMIRSRRLRNLAMRDILGIAEWIFERCDRAWQAQ